jgi:hypothetical protein
MPKLPSMPSPTTSRSTNLHHPTSNNHPGTTNPHLTPMKLMSTMDALGTGALTAMPTMVATGFATTWLAHIVTPACLTIKGNKTKATKKTTKIRVSTPIKRHILNHSQSPLPTLLSLTLFQTMTPPPLTLTTMKT